MSPPPAASRTAHAAPSCGTCPPPSSGSRRRTRSDRAATTWRSSARGTREARRPSRLRPLEHHHRERPLGPLVVGDGDDRGLGDGGVSHERVLERDRRDPLAARFDEIFRAILDLDEAVGMDRDDVARPEPAVVRPAIRTLVRLVVGGGDRGPTHLELPIVCRPTARIPRRHSRGSRRTESRFPASRAGCTPLAARGRSPDRERRRAFRRGSSRSSPSHG